MATKPLNLLITLHKDLFELAERFIFKNELNINHNKFSFLLKLFDKAEIINVSEI